MKNRKRALRKFRKRNLVVPVVVFVVAVAAIVVIAVEIFANSVVRMVEKKINLAKQTVTSEAYNLITNLDEYDYDIDKAVEASGMEIAVIRDDEIVYNSTDTLINVKPVDFVMSDEKTIHFYFSDEDIEEMTERYNGAFTFDYEDEDIIIPSDNIMKILIDWGNDTNDYNNLLILNAWISTDIRYMDGIVLAHSPLSITLMDLFLAVSIILFTLFGLLFVFLMFFIGTIRSVITNNRMIKALYFDDKTLSNNWLFFTTKAEKMIRKKSYVYGFVSVKCCKYDYYKSCSGADNANELLLNKFRELRKLISKKDLIARYSDAYIGILLKRKTVEEIQSEVKRISQSGNEPVYVGVYLYSPVKKNKKEYITEGVEDYYAFAQMACNAVNESDEDGIEYFDDALKEKNRWIHTVESRLDKALANEEFVVYIQPKYNPKDSSLKGAEALIRWVSPEEGLIAPGRFIPICEENGTIVKIDDYMIEHISKLQSEWITRGYQIVPVSVNVSRVHFMQSDLAEHICELVDKYNTPHNTIEIELTESAFFDDKKALLTTVGKLQDFGFQVSMDDFGSGYSSLNSLKDLSLNVLKLDADFFRGESKENRGELIVSKAIELAKALDMETVAEGVEQKEQVEFLASAGCDMIQGYYYDKPMPADEFETRMVMNETVGEETTEANVEQTEEIAETSDNSDTENVEAETPDMPENDESEKVEVETPDTPESDESERVEDETPDTMVTNDTIENDPEEKEEENGNN